MRKGALTRVWRLLSRTDVASALIALVLVFAAVGSCFPQLSSLVAGDAPRLARWESAVRAKYGARADLLKSLGAFRFSSSPLFLASLAALALGILVCTLRRWPGVLRRVFRVPVRCSDAAFDQAPLVTRVRADQALAPLRDIVRRELMERGFLVRMEVVEQVVYLRGDRYRFAPLGTLLLHLAVLIFFVAALLSTGFAWREEVVVASGDMAPVKHVPGLLLKNDGFRIERYPDGHPAAYEAQVVIIEGGRRAASGKVRPNEPLVHQGYRVYLQSYWVVGDRYDVALQVVSDPGYLAFLIAGLSLLTGLVVVLYFPHCYVHARIGVEGTLRLAGWAGRQACGFRREFNSLAVALRRASAQQ